MVFYDIPNDISSTAVDKMVIYAYNEFNPPGDSISGPPPTETWVGPFKGVYLFMGASWRG